MRMPRVAICLIALSVAGIQAATLSPETAAAFDRYVKLTEHRIDQELARPAAFLWIDTLPGPRSADVRKGLEGGGVIIEKLETRDGG